MNKRVFISFSSVDKQLAEKIYDRLGRHGVPCWISSRDVPPGADYQSCIVDAITAAEVVVLVFSSSANVSQEIIKELTLASTKLVIPVRIEDVMPAGAFRYQISNRQFYDLFGDFDTRLEGLCQHVKAVLEAGGVAQTPFHTPPSAKSVRPNLTKPVIAALVLVAIAAGGFLVWRAMARPPEFWTQATATSEPTKVAPAPTTPAASIPATAGSPAVAAEESMPANDAHLASNDLHQTELAASDTGAWKPSFDCAKAFTRSEHLICSNEELAAADVELDKAYRAARIASRDKKLMTEQQASWRKSVRDACPDVDCMLSAHEQRIAELH